jgi:hypothetical protein
MQPQDIALNANTSGTRNTANGENSLRSISQVMTTQVGSGALYEYDRKPEFGKRNECIKTSQWR